MFLRLGCRIPIGRKNTVRLSREVRDATLMYYEGDLVYSTILGQEFIVINSEELAHTLLDQRSGVYSDRPYISTSTLYVFICCCAFPQ
jgi:hypothetical protein